MWSSRRSFEDVHHPPDCGSPWALIENAVFQLLWDLRLLSKHHQPALWISGHLQGLCSCSLQAGRTLWEWAMHFLPHWEAEPESPISHIHSKPISAIPFGPGHQTHSTSEWRVQTPFQLNVPSHQGHMKWKKFTNIVFQWNLELLKLKWDKSGQ